METLLLPGMDGTGRLLDPLCRHLPPELGPRIVRFPADRVLGYEELLRTIDVPSGPFVIVAESFSGPIGVRLALEHADRVRALVLVATFVRAPSPFARWVAPLVRRGVLGRFPAVGLRWALLGMDAPDHEVDELRSVLMSVEPEVLAHRLREVATVDVSADLASISAPILYIAGARDRLLGSRGSEQVRKRRPDTEVRVIDAPHLALARKPIEAAAVISVFVNRVPRGRSEGVAPA